MKKVFLLILLVSTSALGQPTRVLICAPNDSNDAKITLTALQKAYAASIDVSDSITSLINNYDAVFLLLLRHSLKDNEVAILKSFLRENRKLYVEYGGIAGDINDLDSNGFWKYVGIDQIGIDLVNFGVQFVHGVPGTFTEGMLVKNSTYSPIDENFNTWVLSGKIKRILTPSPDPSIDIADIYETDSFKVVLHFPILKEYYTEFLGRVICDYFGLCASGENDKPQRQTTSSIHVYPNPATDFLNIQCGLSYLSPLNIDIVSSAGNIVAKRYIDQNENGPLTLSLNDGSIPVLSKGTYFLRLTTNKEMRSIPFYLNSK